MLNMLDLTYHWNYIYTHGLRPILSIINQFVKIDKPFKSLFKNLSLEYWQKGPILDVPGTREHENVIFCWDACAMSLTLVIPDEFESIFHDNLPFLSKIIEIKQKRTA